MENTSTDTKRGLYAVDVYNETEGVRVALSGLSSGYMSACDASGNVYAGYSGTPSVWKVTDPTGSAVETQLLGNYGPDTGADDDPVSIGMVPTNFGVGTSGQDLVLFDGGLDTNLNGAISVVYADSTEASPHYTTVWSGTVNSSFRGTVSNYDGYAYFINYTLESDNVGYGNQYYINRVKGDGSLQRIFLNIDQENLLSDSFDYAVTTNPLDGSIWFALRETTSSSSDRVVYRIDMEGASYIGDGDYLADISAQLSLTGDDQWSIGNQNLAFSPDGKFLAVGSPGGQDQLYIYSMVPEPATMVLLACGGLLAFSRRRK